jgi:hypothetical protein
MSNAVQTITIIGGLGTLLALVVGLQTFWIARALDKIEKRLDSIEVTPPGPRSHRVPLALGPGPATPAAPLSPAP